jgi:hypothetical protein
MKTMVRNVLAVLVGLLLGGLVNMTIITIGPQVIPPPPGVDTTTTEGLKASMHLLQPKHYIFPFLAHAVGTLVGAVLAYLIAGSKRSAFAHVIGAVSLAGGIAATFMFSAPTWFVVLDLGVAYIPMARLGIFIGQRITRGAKT